MSAIHDLKEKLKSENEELKKIKHNLKDIQEKQKAEKEVKLLKIHAYFKTNTSLKLLRTKIFHVQENKGENVATIQIHIIELHKLPCSIMDNTNDKYK